MRLAHRRELCPQALHHFSVPSALAQRLLAQLVSIPSTVNGLSCGGSPDAAPDAGRWYCRPHSTPLGRPTCARDAGPRDDALQRRRRTPARMKTASGRRSNAASAIKEAQATLELGEFEIPLGVTAEIRLSFSFSCVLMLD